MYVASRPFAGIGRGLVLAAVLSAGCVVAAGGPVRPLAAHGSLVEGDRSFEYDPHVTWFALPNGLTVGLLPDDRANVVSVDVRYQVGAAEDPPGGSGLAHLVEHMTFDQRSEPDAPTLGDRLQQIALYHNASTTWDATHYRSIALAPQVDELLAIEASRLAQGCHGIDPVAFAREHAVVAQETKQRGTSGLADQVRAKLFGAKHAYTRPTGGPDLAKLTLADVCQFLDTYYAPNRAILLVSGRIDPAALRATITARFGAVDRQATVARVPVAPPVAGNRISDLRVPGSTDSALVLVAFPAAPWGSAEAAEDRMLDELMLREIHAPWIVRADAGGMGGARAGVRYIAVTVSDATRLDEAAARVFESAANVAWSAPASMLSGMRARRHTQLLDRFESFLSRATLCADALQYAGDKQCQLGALRALELDSTAGVLARALLRVPRASHVIRIQSSKGRGTQAQGDSHGMQAALEADADAEIDAPVWRAAVDPSEADRPIPMPIDPPATEVSELRLPNGLRVLMVGNFQQPVVEARLVFPVGMAGTTTRDDLVAGAAAYLLEHDLRGPFAPADRKTVRWLLGLGAELSATVTDHTTFQIRGSSVFADWHLWRLAWLVRDGIYARGDLARVRVLAARDQQRAARERASHQAVRTALFGADHPYVRELDLATAAETVSVDELERFRQTYYGASNGTLIITGAFDPAAMRRTVIELFGRWPAQPVQRQVSVIPPMHPLAGPTWFAQDEREAAQVRVTFEFAARSSQIASRAARAVATEMIRARLALIRSQLGASYGIEAGYELSRAGDVLKIDGFVDAGRAGEVIRRMHTDLDQLRATDGTFAADFVGARRAALAAALADLALTGVTASRLEAAVVRRATGMNEGEDLAAAIAAITPRDVQAVIAQDLAPTRMIGVLSGRPADTAKAAATADLHDVRTVGGARQPQR